MKKIILAFCPIAILIVGIYAFAAYSQASKSTSGDSYEHYYNSDKPKKEPGNSAQTNWKDDISSNSDSVDTPDSSSTVLDPDDITLLVNKTYSLDKDYEPDDLVIPNITFSFSNKDPKRMLRKEAAEAIENLFQAGLDEGIQLGGVSGYRSYERQYEIYVTNLLRRGINFTELYSAMPGTSEHQTGLAMDISTKSIGYSLSDRFASTPEGIWVSQNCHKYGFIIRYPKDKTDITGYAYEPWHIRYVGIELATYLFEHDLTLDEYYGYSYEDQPDKDIDYDTIVSNYCEEKGIRNTFSKVTSSNTTSSSTIEDFESLEENLIGGSNHTSSQSSANSAAPTVSATPTIEQTPSPESTKTPTPKPTKTPTPKPSKTPTPKPTKTPTPKPTKTPTPKPTKTPTPTPTKAPTQAPEVTVTPTNVPEPTELPSETPTEGASATPDTTDASE